MTGMCVDPSPVLPWERGTLSSPTAWPPGSEARRSVVQEESQAGAQGGAWEGPQSTHGPNITFSGRGREHSAGKTRSRSESEAGGPESDTQIH